MEERRNTYLAIAITTKCNYKCFYCKKGGESISQKQQTIPYEKLNNIIAVAIEEGIRNFRITGGEPTGVTYFGKLIEYIMEFEQTKIRINTNGFKILKYINILKKYRKRLDIVFSVDSISEYIDGMYFPKFLSEDVIKITRILRNNEIPVRYNIVVTKTNELEVRSLVLKALDDLHINVKLLDLNKFPEYYGNKKEICEKEALDFWQTMFVPMKNFYGFLEEISEKSDLDWTTKMIGKGNGIPMSAYFRKENWVQVKDSERGAKYAKFCKESCNYYKKGECREGVFSLFLSSNLVLHLSGCKNEKIRFDLNKCNDDEIKLAFSYLLKFI